MTHVIGYSVAALVGVGIFLLGTRAGARLQRKQAYAPPEIQAICGCDHHLAYHDPRTGSCSRRVENPAREWETKQCDCKQYTGPMPLGLVYAPDQATS